MDNTDLAKEQSGTFYPVTSVGTYLAWIIHDDFGENREEHGFQPCRMAQPNSPWCK